MGLIGFILLSAFGIMSITDTSAAVPFRIGAQGRAYLDKIGMVDAAGEIGPFVAHIGAGYYVPYKSPMYSLGGRFLLFKKYRPFVGIDLWKCPTQVTTFGIMEAATTWKVLEGGLQVDIGSKFSVALGVGNIIWTRYFLPYLTLGLYF